MAVTGWAEGNPVELVITGDTTMRQLVPNRSLAILAEDGTELLRMCWDSGRLVVTGDESRWDEAAARFIAGVRQIVDMWQ